MIRFQQSFFVPFGWIFFRQAIHEPPPLGFLDLLCRSIINQLGLLSFKFGGGKIDGQSKFVNGGQLRQLIFRPVLHTCMILFPLITVPVDCVLSPGNFGQLDHLRTAQPFSLIWIMLSRVYHIRQMPQIDIIRLLCHWPLFNLGLVLQLVTAWLHIFRGAFPLKRLGLAILMVWVFLSVRAHIDTNFLQLNHAGLMIDTEGQIPDQLLVALLLVIVPFNFLFKLFLQLLNPPYIIGLRLHLLILVPVHIIVDFDLFPYLLRHVVPQNFEVPQFFGLYKKLSRVFRKQVLFGQVPLELYLWVFYHLLWRMCFFNLAYFFIVHLL